MRVAADGLILAANDAARALLGADKQQQVLGTSLTRLIVESHQPSWSAFMEGVVRGSSQSVECDLVDVSGAPRSVMLHGVMVAEPLDGVSSLIIAARDAAPIRRLEAALHESEQQRQRLSADQGERAQAQLEASRIEERLAQERSHLQDLQVQLADTSRERDDLAARLAEQKPDFDDRARQLTELESQLATLRNERDEAQALILRGSEELRAVQEKLERAERDREDLSAQLSERLQERGRALAHAVEQHRAEHDRTQQMLIDLRHQIEQSAIETQRLEEQVARLADELRQSDALRHQQARDHEAHRMSCLEDAKAAAAQLNEADKALSDHRLELQSMDVAIREIEPFAAAGRLAIEIARQLLAVASDIDARSASLVAEPAANASSRKQIEHLCADAVRIGSLARHIMQAAQIPHMEEPAHADGRERS